MDLFKPSVALLAIVNPDLGSAVFHPFHAASERWASVATRSVCRAGLQVIEFFGISLAVEVMVDGLIKLFPVLASHLSR